MKINHQESLKSRLDILDVLRGIAIVLMIIFHFCFLLKELKIGVDDFHSNDFWRYFRSLIVVLFLSLVGMSLKVSFIRGIIWKGYFRRLIQIVIYAMLITVATYLYKPERVVLIGILQFIAITSIVGLLVVRLKWLNLIIGGVIVLIGLNFKSSLFDTTGLHWLGFMTHKPYTLDYVPIFPWFGVVVIGIFLGGLLIENRRLSYFKSWSSANGVTNFLALMGRHSLNIYMLHVPILYAALFLLLN